MFFQSVAYNYNNGVVTLF